MAKKENPLKTFNDAFDKRKAGLQKAQFGLAGNSYSNMNEDPDISQPQPYTSSPYKKGGQIKSKK